MFSKDFLLENLLGRMKWIWKLNSAQFEAIFDPFFWGIFIKKCFWVVFVGKMSFLG